MTTAVPKITDDPPGTEEALAAMEEIAGCRVNEQLAIDRRDKAMRLMHAAGWTPGAIGRRLGLSPSLVRYTVVERVR